MVWIPLHSYDEQTTTCCDCHGFKWQNINISLILISFVYSSTTFLACWIMTTPTMHRHIHQALNVNMIMFYFVWIGEWGHLVLPSILRRYGMLANKSTWQEGWCIGNLSSWELFNYFSKCDFK